MQPVRFGVIGVGGMGGSHAKAFADIEDATLVAVADVNPETTQRVAQETGAKPFADAEELLEKGGVEAIIIATPHFFHPVATEMAAAKGVHVLSEKPMAVTVSAADSMLAAVRKAGVIFGVNFQQRTDLRRRKMKEIIDSGALGKIHRVTYFAPWYRPQAYYGSGSWRGTWKGEGGGVLMNQAPHSMDQFLWMGGQPKSVQAIATTRLHEIEVENTAAAIFDYGEGKVGMLHVSTSEVPTGDRFEVAGDMGVLEMAEGLRFFELEESLSHHLKTSDKPFSAPKGEWREIDLGTPDPETHKVTRSFIRAIRANDESLLVANGNDALQALELANAILMAGYTRKETSLPLSRSGFDDMLTSLQNGVKPENLRA